MKHKLYPCENCGREVPLRSTVRNNDQHKGKKVCGGCKLRLDKKKDEGKREFFERAIQELKNEPYCENCGCRIDTSFMPAANIAHILAKSKYKSVAWNRLNRVFLCAGKNDEEYKNCHGRFDTDIEGRKDMPVYSVAQERFRTFMRDIKEQGKEREIFER